MGINQLNKEFLLFYVVKHVYTQVHINQYFI